MDLLRGRFLRKIHLELFFLLRASLTPEACKTTGQHRPSSTFSDGFSASKDPIHSQPPLLHPVRAAADTSAASRFFTGRMNSSSCMFHSRTLIGAPTFLSACSRVAPAHPHPQADKNVGAPPNIANASRASLFHIRSSHPKPRLRCTSAVRLLSLRSLRLDCSGQLRLSAHG